MTSILPPLLVATMFLSGASGLWSTFLLVVILKGTILLLFALTLALALRRASAASRHLVWALALAALVVLPLFSLALPAWRVPILSSALPVYTTNRTTIKGDLRASPLNAELAPVPRGQQPASQGWIRWILFLWASGVALAAGWMAVGEISVRRITGRSQLFQTTQANTILENIRRRLRISRAVELRVSAEIDIPFTRGVIRPAILLPEDALQWPEGQMELVLAHELAHVYRHDCLLQVPAQVACALFWFHPLVWLAWFQMRKERECACDDVVLSLGHQATDYAEFLLVLGRSLRHRSPVWSTRVAMAQPSQLEVRMKALLNSKLNHRPLAACRVLFAAVLTIMLLVPAAAIRATAKSGTGSVSGTVHDPSGAVIPNASVILINSRTRALIASSTLEDGTFTFPMMPAGRYRLEFAKPGFARAQTGEFDLKPSGNLHQDYTLDLGWVSEEVIVRGHRPAEAAAAPTHAPHRIRVGGLVQAARLIKMAKPVYPRNLEKQGIEGTVILRAVIGTGGKILSLEPSNGADPAFVKSAMDAVGQWRYQPTLLNGVPVEVATSITISFRLGK
jgi:TonB family protein